MIQPAELKALHLQSSLESGWWLQIYGFLPQPPSRERPDKSEWQEWKGTAGSKPQFNLYINHSVRKDGGLAALNSFFLSSLLKASYSGPQNWSSWSNDSLVSRTCMCTGWQFVLVNAVPQSNTKNSAGSLQIERPDYSREITIWSRIKAIFCSFLKHCDRVFRIH